MKISSHARLLFMKNLLFIYEEFIRLYFCEKCKIAKFIEAESRIVVAKGWEEEEIKHC